MVIIRSLDPGISTVTLILTSLIISILRILRTTGCRKLRMGTLPCTMVCQQQLTTHKPCLRLPHTHTLRQLRINSCLVSTHLRWLHSGYLS